MSFIVWTDPGRKRVHRKIKSLCFKETLRNFWNASKSVLIRGREGTRVLRVHLFCIGTILMPA